MKKSDRELLAELEAEIEEGLRIRPVRRAGVKRSDRRDHVVYRFYGADGQLLYVGISVSFMQRLGSHVHRSWFASAVRIELEHFPNRDAALRHESMLIATLAPIHNTAGMEAL